MKKNYVGLAHLVALVVGMFLAVGASAQKVDKTAALENKVKMAEDKLDKIQVKVDQADSLITAGKEMEKEGRMDMKEISVDEKTVMKAFEVDIKPIEKKLNSKDREIVAEAKAEKKELEAKYKIDLKEIDNRYKEAEKKIQTGLKNMDKGKEKKKLLDPQLRDAQSALRDLEKSLEKASK